MSSMDVQPYFDGLYTGSEDPYGVRARWYEQRKRDILLASLPRSRFRHCYEPGCGIGELTVALAARCDAVLAADFSPLALRTARARTSALPQVQLARHALPHDWPQAQRFDLVVLSEVGYFLPLAALRQMAQGCAAVLADDGVLVACDWRPDFAERATATDDVHAALSAIGLPLLVSPCRGRFPAGGVGTRSPLGGAARRHPLIGAARPVQVRRDLRSTQRDHWRLGWRCNSMSTAFFTTGRPSWSVSTMSSRPSLRTSPFVADSSSSRTAPTLRSASSTSGVSGRRSRGAMVVLRCMHRMLAAARSRTCRLQGSAGVGRAPVAPGGTRGRRGSHAITHAITASRPTP